MEVLSPYEGLDEGDWISPRISFSQDFQYPGRFSPKSQSKGSPDEEFSFNFCNSVDVDLPADHSMLSADELFFNGKVRPLQSAVNDHVHDADFGGGHVVMSGGRSIEDSPRCFSMTIESSRGDLHGCRAYMSLHNSRCSSPSRTMSMPRTTLTSPKASSSSASSSSVMPSSPLSSMPSAWTSSSTSSKYSSKFKDFFKLKKVNMNKDASVPSSSASAEISRECPQNSVSASCRHPSTRSFWPFSRSNSAGESKTTPVVLPPPRRSNSAGEGKTTSSSLLPTGQFVPLKKPTQRTHKDSSCLTSTDPPTRSLPSSVNPTSTSPAPTKKGLPPLPSSSLKKTGSFFATAHCGSDAVVSSLQPTASSSYMEACASSHQHSESGLSAIEAEAANVSTGSSPACMRETTILPDARDPNGDVQPTSEKTPHKGRASTASPGRPVRRGPHGNASRNFARGSPGRRGAWNSPGRGNGGRVSVRNLDRGSASSSKGHVRPKDMLNRDGASVRISPVLNVGVPSLRGSKASSKSRIFSLGNLFSKREKATGGMHVTLSTSDSQSGG